MPMRKFLTAMCLSVKKNIKFEKKIEVRKYGYGTSDMFCHLVKVEMSDSRYKDKGDLISKKWPGLCSGKL